MLSLLPQSAAPRLALDIPASLIDGAEKRYEMIYNDNSPLSSPQSAEDHPNPINFSQPMSAPHNQLRYPSSQRNPSSSFYPTPDSAIDHRRMSEPALLNGSHPSAYRPVDSRYNYASSAYSPPALHYPATSRPAYAVHSRTDSNTSSTDYRSQQGHDDAFSDPSNHSPRPSTGSTGAVDSNVHVQSVSPHSSVSPDISTQTLSRDQNPSSPSNPNKTYAFVSLPGTTIRKRPRRRYDEIERLYHCSWPECTKAYGTLNHLNAHVVMQKHGPRRLPSEFKELRKQWRKAKKEGSFGTTQMAASSQSPPNASSYPPQAMNPYYQSSAAMQNSMSDRRRRMTDSSLPGIASYRTSNPYLQSGVSSQPWMEHSQDRRYSLSMPYPPENAVVDDVYGQYDNSSLSAANGQMTEYTQYTTQDQYATTTHGYAYPPLQSPPADQSPGSPHSPPNRAGQRLTSATTLPPLPSTNGLPINRLPSDNGMILNPLDYRSTSGGGPGGSTGGSPSAGSEYDEPRTSYQLQSTSGGYGVYEESVHNNHSHSGQNSEYSLGRNRLPRDSTLLTPVNLDGLRYGKDN